MTPRGPLARLWYSLCWYPCWALAKLMFRFRWSGAEHVPRAGPVLVLSNHQSHLDPALLGVACPRQLRPLARHTLFVGPLGWLIRSLGAVPIDREAGLSGIKTALKLLKNGEAVLVFPEGTRTADGALQPLHPGFCALARRGRATIVPAALHGAFDVMPRGRRLPRLRPITLTFAPAIPPAEYDALSDAELMELVTGRLREGEAAARTASKRSA